MEVGHVTLISGSRVRTGVTAIFPKGKASADRVFAGWWTLNGNGEMTGTTWLEESGHLDGVARLEMLPNERIDPLFRAASDATEEAIVNALVAAETMSGLNGNAVHAIPHDRLRAALKKYNRLIE